MRSARGIFGWVTVLALVATSMLALGPATVTAKPGGRHRGFVASGHVRAGGPFACYTAGFRGEGGWATQYHAETPDGEAIHIESIDDSSKYSWNLTTTVGSAEAGCPLEVWDPALGGGGLSKEWGILLDGGAQRAHVSVDEVSRDSDAPPEAGTTKCDLGASAVGREVLGTTITMVRKDGGYVFETTGDAPPMPSVNCPDGYAVPDQAPGNGRPGGPFFESSSARIPARVLQTSRRLVITISADHSNGPLPNCGIASGPGKCTQTGAWSGTLTLTRH